MSDVPCSCLNPADAPWHVRLVNSFRYHDFSYGSAHPAQSIINTVLRNGTPDDHQRLDDMAFDTADPDTASGILYYLTQADVPWDDPRKAQLVRRALSSTEIGIRYAGIRAVEEWPCPETLEELDRHVETDRFLANYANQVFFDFSPL